MLLDKSLVFLQRFCHAFDNVAPTKFHGNIRSYLTEEQVNNINSSHCFETNYFSR